MSTAQKVSPEEKDCTVLGLAWRRRKKGVSLKQIADTTKIAIRSLQAIESEEFKKLPGGIYNTSYIRQYAKAVNFDESQILTLYHSVMGTSAQPLPENPSESDGNLVVRLLRHTSAVLGSYT